MSKPEQRPKREHPGQKQVSCWIDAGIFDRMSAHVEARGAQFRVEVERALEQYVAATPTGPSAAQAPQ